jgi:DNA polymerase-3 subunit epsilon
VSTEPTPHGPLARRSAARRAARALDGHESDDVEAALEPLRSRLERMAREQRFEDAARLRDRVSALEAAVGALRELRRLRALRACVVVPAGRPGFVRAYALAGGRVAAERLVPQGPAGRIEAEALVAEALRVSSSRAPEDADELRLVASFLRRPPPELRVGALEPAAVTRLADGLPLAA